MCDDNHSDGDTVSLSRVLHAVVVTMMTSRMTSSMPLDPMTPTLYASSVATQYLMALSH